jgi:hypothetical protein|tara:strand:- start:361 stop:945 length:585 start_codon:yes stop_codon:yes gene_type:complete
MSPICVHINSLASLPKAGGDFTVTFHWLKDELTRCTFIAVETSRSVFGLKVERHVAAQIEIEIPVPIGVQERTAKTVTEVGGKTAKMRRPGVREASLEDQSKLRFWSRNTSVFRAALLGWTIPVFIAVPGVAATPQRTALVIPTVTVLFAAIWIGHRARIYGAHIGRLTRIENPRTRVRRRRFCRASRHQDERG